MLIASSGDVVVLRRKENHLCVTGRSVLHVAMAPAGPASVERPEVMPQASHRMQFRPGIEICLAIGMDRLTNSISIPILMAISMGHGLHNVLPNGNWAVTHAELNKLERLQQSGFRRVMGWTWSDVSIYA